MSMNVHKYTLTLLDPFGEDICSMSFHSFEGDDPWADWFMPFLENGSTDRENPTFNTEYRAHVANPRNGAMGFSLKLERT